ncbi:tenascin-like [Seriola dumerili]|uniref:tenascin-like n=1 Tax=Seriola dumerili TaxID=41447 RepID=UPI000BBE9F70|nr:tenascin-like [Seriola dumerili]
MLPFIPSLLLILLLAGPALLTPSTSRELQVRGHRTPRDTKQDSIKVVISEGCANQGDSSDVSKGGKEIDLVPGSPLVLTHKIRLVPSNSGSGSGSCGCEADFAALRERLERLEREVSTLREKCGGAEGGCCTSKESKGAGCSIKPDISECPNECSDQGRCVDGKCICFPGFSGPDCSESNCPGNCNDNGRCVNGQCVCDPGFTGPDCSDTACPNNCNNHGQCVNGKCVCDSGFTGTDCSEKSCPGNCNNKGRCVNGQCVCNPGFTGPDCSKKACPDNCNNRGRCVNGKCVCDSGFTGADCSEIACPGNCNNRGRCINGECVCNDGFGGPDCSERTCPSDCNDRGKCVNGQCVCDSGFTGDDCSEDSCPGNCNNRGRCVNGQCVCDDGFTGAECSEKSCPNNCSNRGKCVNGKCVCNVGFAGPDCSAKGCPNNCNNKGRCVKGRCICRRGFTGQDCSQCEEGMTGPNCDTVMSGVPQLSTRDITETSVTLVWTPPAVQYETYHITFTSQKESDQQITAQVEGSLTTFTQTGLAAGQEYSVTITGEIDGRRGAASSAEFMTLISGPTNLRVVKTTSTSAVVQWEKSQGEIDRYRLTITPSDGAGSSEEITVPANQDSAHIQQLEAGQLYDIILVAEKGTSQSEPTTTQAVPGKSLPRVTMASLTRQVTLAPGQDVGNVDQGFNPLPEVQVYDQQGRGEEEREIDSVKVGRINGPNKDSSASVIARTKPLVSRIMAINGTKPKLTQRLTLPGKPKLQGPLRFNTTRVVPGGRKVGYGPLKKPLVGQKKKAPIVLKKPKTGAPKIGNRTIALTVKEPSIEASSTERRDDKNPAIMSGTDSETNRQSSSEEPKEQPDVGMASQGKDTDPVSSEPTGTFQSQEKKCLNKIKVTHIRLPLKDRGSGCRGDGTVFNRTAATVIIFVLIIILINLTLITYSIIIPAIIFIPTVFSISFTSFILINSSTIIITNIFNFIITVTFTFFIIKIAIIVTNITITVESSSVEVNTPVKDAGGDKYGAATPAFSGVEQNQKKILTERGRIPVRRPLPKDGFVRRPFPNMGSLENRIRSRLLTHPTQTLSPKTEIQKQKISPTELPATSSPVSKESYPAAGTEPVGEENEDRSGMKISTTSVSNELNQTLRGSEMPSSHRPTTKVGYFRRAQLYGGPFQNRTRPNLRPPQHPNRGVMRKPFPVRKLHGGTDITLGSQVSQLQNDSTPEIPDNHSGKQDVPRPTQEVQITQAVEQGTAEIIPSAQIDDHDAVRPEIKSEKEDSVPIQTTKSGEEETSTPDSTFDSDIQKQRVDAGKNNAPTVRGKPAYKKTNSDSRASRPVTLPRRQPPTRIMTGQQRTQMRQYISGSQKGEDPKKNNTAKKVFERKSSADSKPLMESDISSTGVTREPLDYVGVTNRSSDGFTLVWDSPEGKYKNFVVTRKQVRKVEKPKKEERKKDQDRQQEDVNKEEEGKHLPTKEPESGRSTEDENRVPEIVETHIPGIQSSTTVKPSLESDKTFKEVLPGSARSLHFEDLPSQTEYTVTLLGKGPGLLSRLHKLVISTGPEPPTNIIFSEMTENSLTVSWTKPKSPISGFKVTYTHTEEGEPVSVSLDSEESTVSLSQLSPGSTYEVSVISILGLDESDPIKDTAMTLPDSPTDLRAINITDTKALLLWRPALAAIDKYAIVYGSGTGSEIRITVSGNAAEQQLSGLEESTTYTVTITSQLGSQESSAATTSFTTTSGSGKDGDGPRDLQANNVTPRTALLSWKLPSKPAGSYRLTYETEGHENKEVIVDASVTEYNLTGLHPGSKYTVQLQVEGGGEYSTISTEFTTDPLRFPFPSDCSQELLNGIRTSGEAEIFPHGRQGTPMMVYCDMETDGGGWTVFQRRKDGSVDFFRGWKDYIRGFGDLSGEFWLGLDRLHNLTAMTRMSLRVDLRDGRESAFAKYSTFEVARRNYKLTVNGYSGTAGDSLSYHNNRIFSTRDRDLAPFITRCAMSYRGGWWYKNCHEANLNGLYGIDVKHQGVIWTSWKGKEFSIPFTEMKMRPASFSPPARG